MSQETLSPMDQAVLGPIPTGSAALFAEIAELKRVRSAQCTGASLADAGFRRAWSRLVAGDDLENVAVTEVAFAAAHVALGPVDAAALERSGLALGERQGVYRSAAERAFGPLDATIAEALDTLAKGAYACAPPPPFVELLCRQPRAGAVSEGAPRLVLSPEEMHSEHCWASAVLGALIQRGRAEPAGEAFLLGLVHHAPNAHLPDGGFAAEMLLEAHMTGIFARLTEDALAELPDDLAGRCRALLQRKDDLSVPFASAFNAADVIDRVLQQRHYANLAGFSLSDAIDERELVHPGPLQNFQIAVLNELGMAF